MDIWRQMVLGLVQVRREAVRRARGGRLGVVSHAVRREMEKVHSCVFRGSNFAGQPAFLAACASTDRQSVKQISLDIIIARGTCGLASSHFTLAFAQPWHARATRLAKGNEVMRLRFEPLASSWFTRWRFRRSARANPLAQICGSC